MKKHLLICVVIFMSIISLYAKGPKPLDTATITDPVQLTSVLLLIPVDVDIDNKGKDYMSKNYPDILETIIKAVKEQSSIEINPTTFLEAIKDTNCDIKGEKVDLSGKLQLNQYSWSNPNKDTISPRAIVCVVFVTRDDQIMPATVTIHQDDPKNKYGNTLLVQIPLKVTPDSN